ncbi:metallophosphoesterase [Corynebacterium sp.]|jgi:calcineurin-like phosphoesterase family protein|uniref:metallophosphoesterase n=1 Tax=Corynebacterium sp. TaxID=1720 RepID=UPI0025BDF8C7|nr:metallophosphoesterase [Corynebacterium sp.]
MTTNFWTVSDLHLGHRLVADLRGFADTGQHDRVVPDHLREVPEDSVLLCLGDISVRKDAYALARLAELKAEKNLTMWLIPGNHDRVHPMFGWDSVAEWTPRYREIFDVIALDLQVRIGRWQVLMTHIPRATGKDAVPDPHQTPLLARWAGREGFDCTVHGHTHSSVPVRRKHVNLSLEATGLAPVSPERLEELVGQAVRYRG